MVRAGRPPSQSETAATATLTSELKVSVQIDKPALSPPPCHVEGVRKEREHEVDFHVTDEAASHSPGKLTPKTEERHTEGAK